MTKLVILFTQSIFVFFKFEKYKLQEITEIRKQTLLNFLTKKLDWVNVCPFQGHDMGGLGLMPAPRTLN